MGKIIGLNKFQKELRHLRVDHPEMDHRWFLFGRVPLARRDPYVVSCV